MLSLMATQRHTKKSIAVPFTAILTRSTRVSQKVWNTYFMFLSNNCPKQCLVRVASLDFFFFNRPDKNFIDWELELAYVCKAHCINSSVSCLVFI